MSSKAAAPPPGMEPLKASSSPEVGVSSTTSSSPHNSGRRNSPLYEEFPVNSILELTLSPDKEVVRGLVYCTDEISKTIVLKRSLAHTTLASEIRIVDADSVLDKKIVRAEAATDSSEINNDEELAIPLPNVSMKAVEERERRAMKLAEESLRHINQKATPEGQAVFDKLLKACNEVVWNGDSILVLNQIRVDPPYGCDNCKLVQKGGDVALNEGSLERVKRIVEAV